MKRSYTIASLFKWPYGQKSIVRRACNNGLANQWMQSWDPTTPTSIVRFSSSSGSSGNTRDELAIFRARKRKDKKKGKDKNRRDRNRNKGSGIASSSRSKKGNHSYDDLGISGSKSKSGSDMDLDKNMDMEVDEKQISWVLEDDTEVSMMFFQAGVRLAHQVSVLSNMI